MLRISTVRSFLIKICDQSKLAVFSKNKAVILIVQRLCELENDIIQIVPRISKSVLYELSTYSQRCRGENL